LAVGLTFAVFDNALTLAIHTIHCAGTDGTHAV
jgi:hypothetical protein